MSCYQCFYNIGKRNIDGTQEKVHKEEEYKKKQQKIKQDSFAHKDKESVVILLAIMTRSKEKSIISFFSTCPELQYFYQNRS
jgi:hypothetical protein